MELQIALDRVPLDRAVALTRAVGAQVDWVEVGTSLVKRYGVESIHAVVEAAGGTPVLADTKTADDARNEMEMCFDAGARATSVLGMTADATIATCLSVAEERGGEVLIDLLAVDLIRRDVLLAAYGDRTCAVWAPHVGKDSQGGAAHAESALGAWALARRIAVAGGLRASDVEMLAADWPDLRVIVGSAVTGADDPVAAVAEIRAATRASDDRTSEGRTSGGAMSDTDLVDAVRQEVAGVLDRLDRPGLLTAARTLQDAPHVFVAGEGRSGFMARAFAMRLVHLGVTAYMVGETCTPSVGSGDLLVAVSGSGSTAGTLRAAEQATRAGASVMAVTTDVESPVAGTARYVVLVPAATKHRREGEAATIQPLSSLFDQCTHLALDVICLHLAELLDVDNAAAVRAHANTE